MIKNFQNMFGKTLSETWITVSQSFQRYRRFVGLNLIGVFIALVILSIIGQLRFGWSLYFYSDIGVNEGFGSGAMTVVSGMCLFVSGSFLMVGARIKYLAQTKVADKHGFWWWLITGAGLVYLGFDEILMIHEYLTQKMVDLAVPKILGIDQDIYIFALYGLAALALLYKMMPSLIRYREAVFPLVTMLLFFAASEVVDMIPWDELTVEQQMILGPIEEILKTMGSWSAVLYTELLLENVMTGSPAFLKDTD